LAAASGLLLPACEWDGHFTILGYTTQPNYDSSIHSVRVPIFKNLVVQDSVTRGLEFELTRVVKQQIREKTPFKVVNDYEPADTELIGTIIGFPKQMLLRNQQNEVREAEYVLTVELVWRDLRTGEILSQPQRGPMLPGVGGVPVDLQVQPLVLPPGISAPAQPLPPTGELPATPPPPGTPPPPAAPVTIRTTGRFIPELGESNTTALQKAIYNMAIQIVSMMEKPW
jgi:hypothetical protein